MKLPDYFQKSNGEFLVHENELYQVKISLIPFEEVSAKHKFAIAAALEEDKKAQIGLDILGITEDNDRIRKYAWCKLGGFDNEADIKKDGTIVPEHFDCPLRSSCPKQAQKHLCGVLWVNKETYLTPRELQILKLTAEELPDKQIADRLGISINTVNTHRKRIQMKINVYSKVGMARFAIEKNLI